MDHKSGKKPIYSATADDAGQRLDNYLLKQAKSWRKNELYKLIRKGQVRINGKRVKPDARIAEGDQIRVPPPVFYAARPTPAVSAQQRRSLQQQVLYEDANYLVLNKPAGWPVHAGSGHPVGVIEVANSWSNEASLQLAHRLDKDTSGCLLLTKSRQSLTRFQAALQQQQVKKTYLAILNGVLDSAKTVDLSLDTGHRVEGIRTVIPSTAGQSAHTEFTPLRWDAQMTLVRCQIRSGRTHQIRVHAQTLGVPVLGDAHYGTAAPQLPRALYLHAAELAFDQHVWQAPTPPEFDRLLPLDEA
ncbi:RluA family pseudouridine synthase [Marinicella meishanensis]|uniref:RluA family pseudouridine synthase n=1 Tax=Marinicella meishanensis TaxID=2873263 RepID=UPI001CC04059|nr:RluA family pseudouridine synthase [Marinicella sp. NBU2979]